ncbi:MAG TPA: diguanylate cyclase, partial [Acidimicrobiia bacterium]|nr:diguanylate cyclase [Acidimicrobiia bacterium]
MPSNGTRPTTLLLIEEGDADAELFGAILRDAAPAEFEVVRATTLDEAISYLETKTADCAVVDVELAKTGDLEVIETLAARSPRIALVALTDRDDDEIGVATLHARAVDLLAKHGLDGKLLVGSIRHAILLKRFETSLDESQSVAQLGTWEVDLETNTVTWSNELYRVLGFDVDHTPGYDELITQIHPDDCDATVAAIRAAIEDFTPFTVEHRVLLTGGTERWIRARGHVELGADGRPVRLLGMAQNIDAEKSAAAAIVHRELHDALTGLPNRQLLVDRLEQALVRLSRVPSIVGVIYLDMDRFKVINDSLGYPAGDQLLVAAATRLRKIIRPEDTLARMDGDEFVVLCEGLSNQAEAVLIADRICAGMTEPFPWDTGDLVISVSAGVALAVSPTIDAGALL